MPITGQIGKEKTQALTSETSFLIFFSFFTAIQLSIQLMSVRKQKGIQRQERETAMAGQWKNA